MGARTTNVTARKEYLVNTSLINGADTFATSSIFRHKLYWEYIQ